MVTKSWKELEKYVAIKLGGKRLTKASYAESQPDVVVDRISNPVLGAEVYDKQISMIVECKYSIDQPWQRMASKLMADHKTENKVPLVTCDDLLIWDLDDTAKVLTNLYGMTVDKCNLLHVVERFIVIPAPKKVPKYIRNELGQACSYGDWAWKGSNFWIPTVCLGQQGAHRRVMLATVQDLWGIKHDGSRMSQFPGLGRGYESPVESLQDKRKGVLSAGGDSARGRRTTKSEGDILSEESGPSDSGANQEPSKLSQEGS